MNKKIIKLGLLGFALILLSLTEMSAQKLKGISSAGLQIAKSDFGYMAGLDFERYLTNQTKLQIEGFYEISNYLKLKHNGYYLNISMLRDFFDSRNKNVILIGGGATVNYDQLDKDIELGSAFVRNSLNIGALAKIQYEHYVSKRVMFSANGAFNYNLITEFSQTKFWGGVGINYIIY